jgi:hypothetical protein
MMMVGHAGRTGPSLGVHDSLYVRALVMEAGGKQLGLITCDLIGYYDRGILDAARKEYGLEDLLISSSHTHSGPRMNPEYMQVVESAMLRSLDKALHTMQPVKLAMGTRSFPQLGYNRLTPIKDGRGAMWRNYERIPYGPVDPEVTVLRIDSANNTPIAIVYGYACHPVTEGWNYDLSAEYPGLTNNALESTYDDAISLFILGGAGDINPMFMMARTAGRHEPPTDYSPTEKMSELLAEQVMTVTDSLKPRATEQPMIKIKRDTLFLSGRYDEDLTYEVHIATVLLNQEIAIATFPGEPHVKHQLYWKQNAPVPHPFFFGYTFTSGGESPGYVPDIRRAALGGYGADENPKMIEPGSGEKIMNTHLVNIYKLLGMMSEKPPQVNR